MFIGARSSANGGLDVFPDFVVDVPDKQVGSFFELQFIGNRQVHIHPGTQSRQIGIVTFHLRKQRLVVLLQSLAEFRILRILIVDHDNRAGPLLAERHDQPTQMLGVQCPERFVRLAIFGVTSRHAVADVEEDDSPTGF